MNHVLYSATLIQAFARDVGLFAILLGLETSILWFLRHGDDQLVATTGSPACVARITRYWLLFSVVVIGLAIMVSLLMGIDTYRAGPQAMIFVPQKKEVAPRASTKGPPAITHLVRPVIHQPVFFEVSPEAYEQIALDRCYRFVYYGRPSWTQAIFRMMEIRELPIQSCWRQGGNFLPTP